jgi:protein TonB
MTWQTVASGVAAVSVHAAVLLGGGGLVPLHAPEYGVQVGDGIDVDLVAAPAGPAGPAIDAATEALAPSEPDPEPLPMPVATEEPSPPPSETPTPALQREPADPMVPPAAASGNGSEASGDGSSPVPGRDPTTLRLVAGASSAGRAKYLRNPAPPYPWDARRQGQAGLVLLRARISVEGRALDVQLAASCGFPLLDRSALDTVRTWRFLPAHAGGLPAESTVDIPIRFVLER